MTPEDIRRLRSGLRCTARELAATLNIPLAEVRAWEAGERFPTKQWVNQLEQLVAKGPEAIVRKPAKGSKQRVSAMDQLDNPELWLILRKLLAHPKLFSEVSKLAASYDDPAATED